MKCPSVRLITFRLALWSYFAASKITEQWHVRPLSRLAAVIAVLPTWVEHISLKLKISYRNRTDCWRLFKKLAVDQSQLVTDFTIVEDAILARFGQRVPYVHVSRQNVSSRVFAEGPLTDVQALFPQLQAARRLRAA